MTLAYSSLMSVLLFSLSFQNSTSPDPVLQATTPKDFHEVRTFSVVYKLGIDYNTNAWEAGQGEWLQVYGRCGLHVTLVAIHIHTETLNVS